MFVLIAILLGIIIGTFRKGKVSRLFREPPKLWILGLLGLLMQLGLHLLFYTKINFSLISVVNFLSYLMIIVSLLPNYKNIWISVLAIGFITNCIIIFANGGTMPVAAQVLNGTSSALANSITGGTNAVYMLMDQSTTWLCPLEDFFFIPKVGIVTSIYGAVPSISVGTFIILIGTVGYVQGVMTKGGSKEKSFFEREDQRFDETEDKILNPESNRLFLDNAEDNDFAFFRMGEAILEDKMTLNDTDLTAEEAKYLEEEALTDMTDVIPKLTPEMIAEIRQNALEDGESSSEGRDSAIKTKVYTSFKNLDEGKADEMAVKEKSNDVSEMKWFEQDQDILQDTFEEQWLEDDQEDDRQNPAPQTDRNEKNQDTAAPLGGQLFFESERRAQGIRESDLFNEVLEDDGRKELNWNPQEIEKASRQAIREQTANPYSTLYNRTEKKSIKGKSLDEMRNIWHQANESASVKRRYRNSGQNVSNGAAFVKAAENAGNERVTIQKQPEPVNVSEFEKVRNTMADKWDETKKMPKIKDLSPKKSTERVDSQEVLRQSISRKSEERMAEAFTEMERKKAGYEKVEVLIDGRVVSFWKKKK